MKFRLGLLVALCAVVSSTTLAHGQAAQVGTDITGLSIHTSFNKGTTVKDVTPSTTSTYKDNTTINFMGLTEAITGFDFNGGTATIDGGVSAKVSIVRNPATDKRQVVSYVGDYAAATKTFTLWAPQAASELDVLNGNNYLLAVDNVFENVGSISGSTAFDANSSNERVDYILASPIKASKDTGFAVFDYGVFNQHDPFGIAAIMGADASGKPTAYGPITMLKIGWGQTPLAPTTHNVLTNMADGSDTTIIHPTLTSGAQALGGILLRTSELAKDGDTIYGYSLFAPDVTCTPDKLVNATDSCFPTTTGTEGGIDMPGVNLGAVSLKAK